MKEKLNILGCKLCFLAESWWLKMDAPSISDQMSVSLGRIRSGNQGTQLVRQMKRMSSLKYGTLPLTAKRNSESGETPRVLRFSLQGPLELSALRLTSPVFKIAQYEILRQWAASAIGLTGVAIVLRRARHDGRHALTTVRRRVNVTWSGAPPLLHIQAVIVLRTKRGGRVERGAGGRGGADEETQILDVTGGQQLTCLNLPVVLCCLQGSGRKCAYLRIGRESPKWLKKAAEREQELICSLEHCGEAETIMYQVFTAPREKTGLRFILHGGPVRFSAWDKAMMTKW